MTDSDPTGRAERRAGRLLRIALGLTTAAVLVATFLLIKETAYNFVVFMFVGPPLIAVAAICLGWVIFQELRHKKVL